MTRTADDIGRELVVLAEQRRALDAKQTALSDEYVKAQGLVIEQLRAELTEANRARDGWRSRALDAERALEKHQGGAQPATKPIDTEGGAT